MIRYFAIAVSFLCGSLTLAADIEEPRWELIGQFDRVELRQYAPVIQAVTELSDSGETSEGFRRLAGYIFGGNSEERSIAMTAPVQETLSDERPVMTFTMPSQYALEDLPAPDDKRVSLRPLPRQTVAAIPFSGWATSGKVERMTEELLGMLERHGLSAVGSPMLNQYNPPWTLPFMRRNEVVVQVEWREPMASLR